MKIQPMSTYYKTFIEYLRKQHCLPQLNNWSGWEQKRALQLMLWKSLDAQKSLTDFEIEKKKFKPFSYFGDDALLWSSINIFWTKKLPPTSWGWVDNIFLWSFLGELWVI